MYVDKDGSPLGKLSERLAVLPVRKARRKELSGLVDRAIKLEDELHNAQVRISDRDLKIERQKEHIAKLEASRKGLKTENAALRVEDLL